MKKYTFTYELGSKTYEASSKDELSRLIGEAMESMDEETLDVAIEEAPDYLSYVEIGEDGKVIDWSLRTERCKLDKIGLIYMQYGIYSLGDVCIEEALIPTYEEAREKAKQLISAGKYDELKVSGVFQTNDEYIETAFDEIISGDEL